jgi:hypothetical protein
MASETQDDRLKDLGFEIQDPERFAHNMSRLMEETGKAVAERRMLELRKAARETPLERLVVPDNPYPTRRRGIFCPRKPDLLAVCGEDVVKRVQVRAPPERPP